MNDVTRRDALKLVAAGVVFTSAGAATAQDKETAGGKKSKDRVEVKPGDFESLGKKLEGLKLSQGEAHILEFLLENAASAARQVPPPKWLKDRLKLQIKRNYKYRPRGAKHLVASGGAGADGLTILVTGRGKIVVVRPEGPLPTELPEGVLDPMSIG
jgi:hypothetical protein